MREKGDNMNNYSVIAIGIVAIMVVALIMTLVIAVIKGFRPGSTVIEVKFFGIFSVVIHLTDVSKK